jgi:hypothetical protein
MTRYLAQISSSGLARYGQFPFAIGVLAESDLFVPISMASVIGRTEDGLAVWKLTVHEVEVPGRWVIEDLESRPARWVRRQPPLRVALCSLSFTEAEPSIIIWVRRCNPP